MKLPERFEIEYELMKIFGRVEVKKDIRDAATYILKLLKKVSKNK